MQTDIVNLASRMRLSRQMLQNRQAELCFWLMFAAFSDLIRLLISKSGICVSTRFQISALIA